MAEVLPADAGERWAQERRWFIAAEKGYRVSRSLVLSLAATPRKWRSPKLPTMDPHWWRITGTS